MALPLINGKTADLELRPLLDWPSEVRPDRLALLEQVLRTCKADRLPGAIIPRYVGDRMVYYAVAANGSQWRQLVPLLRSAVGLTVSDFTGATVEFGESDPFEAALLEVDGLIGTRFTSGADQDRGRYTLSALARLTRHLDEMPSGWEIAPRTTGEVLRSFELAIAGLDRAAAQDSLTFLSSNRRIDAVNLRFLTVRLHAEFKEWEQLRGLEFFSALCQVRRSSAVTNAMAEALYQTTIRSAELDGDTAGALELFKREIYGNSGSLFTRRPLQPSPAAGKAFALNALSMSPINLAALDSLKEAAAEWATGDAEFLENLIEISAGELRARAADVANPMAVLEDDGAVATVEAAIARMLTAMPLEDSVSSQLALDYVGRLPEEKRRSLLENRAYRAVYDDLRDRVGVDTVPRSWIQWLNTLTEAPTAEVRAWAANAVHEWPVADQLSAEGDAIRISEAINGVPPFAEDTLFDTLPFIVSWVRSDPRWPFPPAAPLYITVYELLTLLLSSGWRREAVSAAMVLLDGLLELGPNQNQYRSLLNGLRSVIPQEAGASDIESLLDLTELAVTHACPDPEARQGLWSRTYGALAPIETRFSKGERALANQLAALFGMPDLFPEPERQPEDIPQRQWLIGKTIAVHTLNESVGDRVRLLVEQLYPGVVVRLSYDKVASPQLDELARNADVFVICWRSSAHAATNRISQLRPKTARTLWPEGKGSSSILRVLNDLVVALS